METDHIDVVPLGDRVAVRLDDAESVRGGVHIPDIAQSLPFSGVVVGVGPDVRAVEVGDHVLFGQYSGSRLPFHPEELLICREEELIAKIVDKTTEKA